MDQWRVIAWALCFVLVVTGYAGAELVLVNYSEQDIPASQVCLPAASVYELLELESGQPLAVLAGGHSVPVVYNPDGDQIKLYVGLPAKTRTEVTLQPADSWWDQTVGSHWDEERNQGWLANGVLRADLDGGVVDISYADGLSLLGGVRFSGWLDRIDRGFIDGAPLELGLLPLDTGDAKGIVRVQKLDNSGEVGLTITRQLSGFAAQVQMVQRVSLAKDLPLLLFSLQFDNQGSEPVYLAWADGGLPGTWADGNISGTFLQSPAFLYYPYQDGAVRQLGRERFAPVWNTGSWAVAYSDAGAVGITTLQQYNRPHNRSHFHNKSWWEFSGQFFSMPQTGHRDGHMPIRIGPGETETMGQYFLFVPPGVDGVAQTAAFYEVLGQSLSAINRRYTMERPYAAYFGGEVIHAGASENLSLVRNDLWVAHKGEFKVRNQHTVVQTDAGIAQAIAAVRMDFGQKNSYLDGALIEDFSSIVFRPGMNITTAHQRPIILQLDVAQMTEGAELTVSVGTIPLIVAHEAGSYTVDVSKSTDWQGVHSFTLDFGLQGPAGSTAKIGQASIGLVPEPGPELMSPVDDMDITDFALHFKWQGRQGITAYQLQLDSDPEFAEPTEIRIGSTTAVAWHLPDEILPPGTYYWRVRAEEPTVGQWSSVRSFRINQQHHQAPLLRPVGAGQPLFTLEAHNVRNLNPFINSIPADIRPYTAINVNNKDIGTEDIVSIFAELDSWENQFLVRPHGPGDRSNWASLADVEWLFQQYPQIIGLWTGENFWTLLGDAQYEQYVSALIRLAAKYGRLYIWGDGNGNTFKWQQFASHPYWAPLAREYSDYLVFSLKNNVGAEVQHTNQGAILGMWLGGLIGNHGSVSEVWYWNTAGFGRLGQYVGEKQGLTHTWPANFYNIAFILSLAQGGTVFSVDGQHTTRNQTTSATIWNAEGQVTPTFNNYIVPFIRAVVEHGLTVERQAVLDHIQVAVRQPQRFHNIRHHFVYGPYEALFAGTYGLEHKFEYIPNRGRYYFIPLLPLGVDVLDDDTNIVDLDHLSTTSAVEEIFQGAYPPWYDGDAFAVRIDGRLFILNSNENRDMRQDFSVPLANWFTRISGEIEPHAYLMGRIEEERLVLVGSSEYLDRDARLTISSPSRPGVEVIPEDAIVAESWDATAGELNVVLSHRPAQGSWTLVLEGANVNE